MTIADAPDPFAIAAALLDPTVPDPATWAKDTLGIDLTAAQADIARSVRDNRRTAVKACHDSGKSFVAAVIVAWWLSTHLPGEAFVVTSAPSWPQVRAILWREIRALFKMGPLPGYVGEATRDTRAPTLPGRVNQTEWLINEELVGYGRKPADHDANGFQGIHAMYVLVVLDEACGIPTSLWTGADSIITNEDSRLLVIGNPDAGGNEFETAFEEGSGFHPITIRAEDTPNFTNEPVPDKVARSLLSRLWVDEMRHKWATPEERRNGTDPTDPRWMSKVLAEFPTDDVVGVVPRSWLTPVLVPRDPEPVALDLLPVVLGVDVGGGGDATVIRERAGVRALREWEASTPRPEDVVDLVLRALVETGATEVYVDAVGIGWGVVGSIRTGIKRSDRLRGAGIKVYPVNVGEAANDKAAFGILRDEVWWRARTLTQDGDWDLSGMENADETVRQICAPRWTQDDRGKIRVERKDETRKRLGRSPDNADALLLAYCSRGVAAKSKAMRSH